MVKYGTDSGNPATESERPDFVFADSFLEDRAADY